MAALKFEVPLQQFWGEFLVPGCQQPFSLPFQILDPPEIEASEPWPGLYPQLDLYSYMRHSFPNRIIEVQGSLAVTKSRKLVTAINKELQQQPTQLGTLRLARRWPLLLEESRSVWWPLMDSHEWRPPQEKRYDDHERLSPMGVHRPLVVPIRLRFIVYPFYVAGTFTYGLGVPDSVPFADVRIWEQTLLDDPDARLIYADWCEERRWTERVEILRTK